MRLYLAGIDHNDPLGRRALHQWLKGIKESVPPEFVAVEWGQEVFDLLKAKRSRLHMQLKERFPQVAEEVIQCLSASLAYEGDAHTDIDIFSNANVLWLDEDRICLSYGKLLTNEEIAKKTYLRQHSRYELWLVNRRKFPSPQEFLLQVSHDVWADYPRNKTAAPAAEVLERDSRFANIILEHIQENGWGIIITGAQHAEDEKGRMRHLLKLAGHDCTVDILCPPNAPD